MGRSDDDQHSPCAASFTCLPWRLPLSAPPRRTLPAADYHYCQAGLVSTGTVDDLANGSNCAYWLLRNFPSPATGAPIPGLDVLRSAVDAGAGVTVAVLDTGVDPRQADFGPTCSPGWSVSTVTR